MSWRAEQETGLAQAEPDQLSTESFTRIARYVTRELGIKMPEAKASMVQSRLMRRARELRLKSVDHYADYFFDPANQNERQHLINAITTNKTDFFREPAHFDLLVSRVLPERMSAPGMRGGRFKVWSAGCSSGEEPYTLAMVLTEAAAHRGRFDFALLATDVSTKVLRYAQSAIYPEERMIPVPEAFRRRYLMRGHGESRGLLRIVPELRRKVTFHQLNLMDDDYRVNDMFDAVFFRNVMIYFDRPTQERVVGRLCRNLAPGGYLFIGHSETLAGLDVPVDPVGAAVYRKRT